MLGRPSLVDPNQGDTNATGLLAGLIEQVAGCAATLCHDEAMCQDCTVIGRPDCHPVSAVRSIVRRKGDFHVVPTTPDDRHGVAQEAARNREVRSIRILEDCALLLSFTFARGNGCIWGMVWTRVQRDPPTHPVLRRAGGNEQGEGDDAD